MFKLSPVYMRCNYCKGMCIKKGKYGITQKYQCKACKKYQRAVYCYCRYDKDAEDQVRLLNNEGVGIASIGRILGMPRTSVLMVLSRAAAKTAEPDEREHSQEYEIDEVHTYIGKKASPCYITYAINRLTRTVIDFVIGARTKENIGRLIDKLMLLAPKRIYTDKLNIFPLLIPAAIHRTYQYKTNRIERKNLTIRTHLKRLSRRTICYSKSVFMLEASFRLYAFG